MSFPRIMWRFRSTLFTVLWPILMLPIPLVLQSSEASCGYCILIMVGFWITEVIPLAVTSFLPLVLFPLMSIMPAGAVSMQYTKDFIWLFVGGLIIAIGVEHTRLHKRFALRILLSIGNKPHSLLLGFMLPTYILSMWMSNVASTAVMIPIVEAVLVELGPKSVAVEEEEQNPDVPSLTAFHNTEEQYESTEFHSNQNAIQQDLKEYDIELDDYPAVKGNNNEGHTEMVDADDFSQMSEVDPDYLEMPGVLERTKKGLTLCVPYSASIGGIATLTGTGANFVLAGLYPEIFPDSDITLSFSIWFAYHLPLSAVLLCLAYVWMMWLFLGINFKVLTWWCKRNQSPSEKRVQKLLQSEYKKLGKIRWSEVSVLTVLIITILLWFFREPGFMTGWSILFLPNYVSDGTVAMTMATLLFFLPSDRPMFMRRGVDRDTMKPVPPLLSWKTVHQMFPWNVMFLIGGGFALAEGASKLWNYIYKDFTPPLYNASIKLDVVSGFSQWLGDQLAFLDGLPDWVICLIVTLMICAFTEFTGNTATASLFVPIIAQLAQLTEIHPLYLLLPAVVSTSLAFMLPVATPPNAMAFSHGHLEVLDLVRAGSILNLLGILVLMVFINTYGIALFGLDDFPAWAAANYTSTIAPTPSYFF